MAVIVTVRPTSTLIQGTDVTVVPSGTAHGVLSDDNDSTYVETTGLGSTLRTRVGTAVLPANHQWHRARGRIRCRSVSGSAVGFIDVGRGDAGFFNSPSTYTSFSSVGTTITEVTSGWFQNVNLGLDRVMDLSDLNLLNDINAGGGFIRIMEAYLDLDARHYPVFTATVLDGSGASAGGGTVTDTDQVRFVFGSIDTDGLPFSGATLRIINTGTAAEVYQEAFVSAPSTITVNLPNGAYRATFIASSTIRGTDLFTAPPQNIEFDVDYAPPAANPVNVTPTDLGTRAQVCWAKGSGGDYDEGSLVVEILRSNCEGAKVIARMEGEEWYAGCYEDRFVSFARRGVYCGEPQHFCSVSYYVRYSGTYGGIPQVGPWVFPSRILALYNPTPGNGWLSGVYSGDMSVCEKKSWTRSRPQALYTPALGGKPTVTTGATSGRDFTLEIATTTLDDLHLLESILAQPYVYYRPADLPAQWCAPETESVQVVQVGRVRVVSVTLRAVEAPPL